MVEWISHRGESYDAPENTLAAFKLAWQRNTDGIELDIHLSLDHSIVVMHDPSMLRTAGLQQMVRDLTLDQLKQFDVGKWKNPIYANQQVPTLSQVVETIPKDKRALVEIKAEMPIVPILKQKLSQDAASPSQITFMCFSLAICTAVKQQLPDYNVYWLGNIDTDAAQPPTTLDDYIDMAKQSHLDGLALHYQKLNEKAIKKIHHAELWAAAWTINEIDDAQRLINARIDTIISDRAAYLRDACAKGA